MSVVRMIGPGVARARARREVSVRQVLEWAFGVEHARIETDPLARLGAVPASSVGMEYVLMQRARLGGVRIDTSIGVSQPHEDAEVVASVVERLAPEHGGMGMALRIAELARAGMAPDWMPDARPRLVPANWRGTKHGQFAATEVAEVVEHVHRGRRLRREVRYCPCSWSPTADQISAARRDYLAWWSALLWLRQDLKLIGLRDHVVTDVMPRLAPWQ